MGGASAAPEATTAVTVVRRGRGLTADLRKHERLHQRPAVWGRGHISPASFSRSDSSGTCDQLVLVQRSKVRLSRLNVSSPPVAPTLRF